MVDFVLRILRKFTNLLHNLNPQIIEFCLQLDQNDFQKIIRIWEEKEFAKENVVESFLNQFFFA